MAVSTTVAAIIGAAAMAASTGYSIYQGERAVNMQDDAQRLSRAQARQTAQSADEATNRANQKRPNANAILAAAQQAAKGGMGGTLLTGPQGVNTGELSLGKSTLLGG